MCGIAGILSKKGENVVPIVGNMLSHMVHRGPDGAGISAGDKVIISNSLADLRYNEMKSDTAIGHTRLAIVGGLCGQQPFKSCDGRITLEHNGEIYNYKKIRAKLIDSHQFRTETDSEVIVHLIEHKLEKVGNMVTAIKEAIAELDGVYALVIRDEITGIIHLVRDKMGVRQLYYGENNRFVAFASERKALWKIGIKEANKRVLPGYIVSIYPDGRIIEFKIAEPPVNNTKIRYKTMQIALKAYERALKQSMKKRLQDFDRVGIIFSGGIDSVLIAWLAKKMVKEVICYTGGVKDSNDIIFARKIAKSMDLKLRVNELSTSEVEQMLPEIINTIEDNNVGQVEVAIPVYAAVKMAHDDGIKMMLTGQAADELFGGYAWYTKVVEKLGFKKLREHMTEDLLLLYKETLEREDKITMAHSIEMREPFLDMQIIKLSMQIDPKLNVKGTGDIFGKHVHRKLAQKLGIPKSIAYRIKEAAQHGSGLHFVLESIARQHGFDESTVSKNYIESLKQREKIGSSQRYGYLYEDKDMWIVSPHVQLYIDSISRDTISSLSVISNPIKD
jgi:asparagine synthase (glutamine-hydrolysing)